MPARFRPAAVGLMAPLLLLAACAALATAQDLPLLDIPPSQLQALSSVKGCGGAELGVNMNDCLLEDNIKIGDQHEYSFVVPERMSSDEPFSLLITAKSIGGLVEMYAIGPGKLMAYNQLYHLVGAMPGSTAMAEMFIRVRGSDLAPGNWRLRLVAKSGDRKAAIYSVRVQTPATATRLNSVEKAALKKMTLNCCDVRKAMEMGASNVHICAAALPAAVEAKTNGSTDICQIGPFMCTPEGRLQKLMLGGAGLSCPVFPTEIASFEGLHTIEMTVAVFGKDTWANVAKTLSGLKNLERITFRDTDLSGPIPCGLVDGKKRLKMLDISDSPASGEMPGCLLAVPTLEEFFFTRTRMTGALPNTVPKGSPLRIMYSWNRDPNTYEPWGWGFSGSLPSSLRNAEGLADLVLPFHKLGGELPPLPNGLVWLDLKGNQFNQMPAALPLNVRIFDFADNGAAGSIPDLTDNTLVWANLSSNRISGPLPGDWGGAALSLQVLSLRSNNISGDLSGTNWNLPYLEMLDLSSNALTGSIPADLATVPHLNYLNLANNQLYGSLDDFANALPDVGEQDPSSLPKTGPDNRDPPNPDMMPAAFGRRRLLQEGPPPGVDEATWKAALAAARKAVDAPAPVPDKADKAPAKEDKAASAKDAPAEKDAPAPAPAKASKAAPKEEDSAPAPSEAEQAALAAAAKAYVEQLQKQSDASDAAAAADADQSKADKADKAPPAKDDSKASSSKDDGKTSAKGGDKDAAAPPDDGFSPAHPNAPIPEQMGSADQQKVPIATKDEPEGAGRMAEPKDKPRDKMTDAEAAAAAAADAAAASDTPTEPEAPPVPFAGSKMIFLDVSNNQLTGAIPSSLSRLGVFHFITDAPTAHQPFHYLVLSNNDLWSEIPGFMLDAISLPTERNPCRCSLYLNLANNTRFCPTRATVGSLKIGTVEALTAPGAANITCRRDDFTQVLLRKYLDDPAAFITSIPDAPAPKPHPVSASASAAAGGGASRRGHRAGGMPPGAVAGVVIGVIGVVGALGALGYFVVRPIYKERRATGFFKTKELDLAMPPQQGGVAAAAVMESGWNRTI